MLYLLNKDVRTVRWNGEPLHEATSAIVKETMNGDFTLTVKYPISDSGIYQLIQEDMLIKAPTPVLGAQLFRIKKPVENNDHLEITAYHISDDVMQRSITPVSVTSQSCGMALSRMVQNTKTALGDFSFNSDIQDRRTFNTTEIETLYSVLLDGKHSIVGTWEGELVRDNFAMTVKKSRGENRGVVITTHKNLKDYQRTKSSQNVVTRIHARSTFKPEGAEKETTIRVTVDSPLINSYPYINEKEYENNNAKSVEELQKWAQSKFSNEGIDKVSDAIKIEAYELDGQVVHMGDTVNLKSWKHNVDAFKKAIAYEFDALKEEYISLTFDDKAGIGGSRASGGLSSAADAILGVTESAQEIALEKALQNADLDFDHKAGLLRQEISDDIELAKARAEEVKRELSDTINQRFNSFDNGPLKETKRKAEEALRNAGASTLLAQEAKRIGLDSVARLEAFKSQTTSAQTALSGDLDALKRTIANDIRPKQAQAEAEIAKQAEALSRTKNELAGASTLLAQEAKRIELDSVARLEAFKSQTTSAQTALSGDLDVLKQTIANDIRPKQAQAEAEIAKQVEALSRTKNELAGVKSAQATYKETTTRRLSELTNLANGKASKSELTQTAEELASKIASVQVGGRNYIRGTKRMMLARGLWASGTFRPSGAGTAKTIDVSDSPVTGFDKAIRLTSSNARDQIGIAQDGFYISQGTYTMSCWVKGRRGQKVKLQTYWQVHDNSGISPIFTLKDENWTKLSFTSARNRAGVASIGYVYLVNAEVGEYLDVLAPQLEDGSLATSSKEAPEDIEGQISTVESTFKQRANSLDAGVNRLTEGLRTKVDISALNVTAENIRQSVKSLETDTQNKLNQKLSQAEFEVRAGSIRQEILNATKDKASKSELTQTAEELASKIASVQASGRNLFLNSLFKQDISKTGIWTTSTYTAAIDSESKYLGHKALKIIGLNPSGRDGGNPKVTYPALGQFGKVISGSTTNQDVTISFYAKANKNGIMLRSRLGNIGYKTGNVTLSTEIKRYVVHIPKGWTNESKQTTNEWLFNFNQEGTVWIWMPKFEISDVDTSYSEAPEDIEGQISTVESTFKQRANSLDAGVRSLTEGLRTKVDISALNVTAENIRQSVKSLETDTQNKLNQKLSQAEFEVRAGSIRQEILNATKDKASKSELTQTAEELSSKIASVQVGGINLLRNTASLLIGDRSKGCWMSASGGNGRAISVEVLDPPKKMIKNMIRVIENTNGGNKDLTQLVRLRIGEKYTISCYARIASDSPNANVNLLFRSWANNTDLNRKFQKSISHKNWQKYSFTFTADAIENSIQFGQSGAGIIEICAPKIESGTLATDYSEAPEDIEGQISTVESTFKQRANSLDAGVSRLTEGLRTKVDISALNVTAENIRQSVKSLETDTQNKLNQKLSQAEFEVRAGSIRQEILNATKDKADKTLVVSEAGKLREEFSKMKVGGRNLWIKSKTVGAVIEKLPENHVTGQKECYRLENNSTLTFNLEPDFSSRLYQKVTFSAWIKYENVVQGRNFWNVFNCFKHYLFRKNSETGVQSGPDYATLGMYKGSADWKYIAFTYDYSEKTNFDQLKTSLRFNLEGATSGTAWVTGIKVEIGSVATDWSPAPEDADGLITEAKATFERTAQGLRTDLSAIQEYVNKDGQRQEALQRYTREESARQATAVRELVNRDFVGKATYQEDVKGINQRIEAVKTSANKDIASQIASYRQSVDGKFTDISSQITTYKQDVGGQISGLSNRLTSSEQGTTTQISNISNRINSNKQGTDNQISNLKTQVATNKDNAERQMGRISDQVSANKANADSQFANVTNQLVRKVETTDFQRVKETSKLYERILGNTENGIADKVARMALTNQLFQVEVGKVAKGGRNYIRNGQFKNGSKNWLEYQSVNFGLNFNYQHSQNPNNRNRPGLHFYHDSQDVANFFGIQQSFAFDGVRGEKVSVSLLVSKDGGDSNSGLKVALHYIKNKNIIGQEWQNIPSPQITSKYKRFTFTFTLSDDVENLNLMLFGEKGKTINLYVTDVQLERGSVATDYKEAPEDTDEAIRSVQSQLTGSWAVQNINSAGDIISGINLGANGHNRFVGKLTHITGETLIDRAVIKSAMVDKLKTANFEAGSVTTTILDAEAVTAEKVKVDNALIKKLTANDAFIYELISKRIFSTKVESVISSSTFLEAYQGRIGGFTLGQFDQGGGRWISGVNQFSVGMGNGAGHGVRTAFWANWGNNWNYAGPKAWNVNTDGKMYCRNEVGFYDQVDFSNSSRANFYGNTTFSRSPVFSNGIELGSKDVLGDGWNPKGGRNAVVWWNQVGSGSLKYWMEQKSDRRLKENITDTAVKALDKINRLRMVAFDFIENKKHEEIGLIAQEAETIVPRIVSRDPENPDGYLHIDYTALVPYLIKAIQELNQKIEKMEKTIA
ncbi:PblB [Streptococcus pneumoniae]|uniref:phage tail spike protein n=1 Tax=Streptococcus pneumoniae TaxID=1313 RepID=UPI0007690E4A|nr:phage tail spike protein [Streptococcus pneumoniae]MDS2221948.1 phage tail spike protein [Streptococcus pneumoniae]MDS2397079.1 phage tail spike protein [Streptococcus pneumoniae]MDS3067003.1 phage tail spike protein [Streptococcus pneumoniae]MDS5363969.1 phage tail spike protein [Streptococcus pneumoniae]MDS5428711.1 phage tail spike protein [Streptococcus pneumoniae]